jgi:hypothetical protein
VLAYFKHRVAFLLCELRSLVVVVVGLTLVPVVVVVALCRIGTSWEEILRLSRTPSGPEAVVARTQVDQAEQPLPAF